MADPIVHITNGIPDLGTGNITTLGQTLLDGANLTLGATTDAAIAAGAAGTINAHLRSISRDIAAGIVIQAGGATIGNVGQAGAPWTQNITQFGSSAVVTGTGIGGAGIPRVTVSSDSSMAVTQSGTWDIRNITGTVPLPSGASTSAKQPALGTAGVPSADVITVQGVTGMTALKVDGTGGSFPVSGTVAATQSGTWNITNVSGTVSLPTGAAVAAKQPSLGTAGAPSADVITIQGSASMTAVKINLLGSSGTVLDFPGQNAASPANAVLTGAQFNTTPTTLTSGNVSPLQLDSSGNLLVNIKAGAGSGGTASNFGSSFPTAGTAAGVKDSAGVNMTFLQVNASNALKVDGSAVTQPVSGTFWQATQPVSGTVAISGITGTVSLPTGAATSALQPSNSTLGAATSGQTGNLSFGAVTSGAPAYTTATSNALSLTTAGALRVDASATTQPVSGTVAVSGSVAVTGTFWQATQPVSGTITANQGGAPWTMKPDATAWTLTGTSANVNVTNTVPVTLASTTITGTVAATQSGSWTVQQGTPPWLVGGDVANAAADSGNPVKIGGIGRTSNPTAVTNAQRVNALFDKLGKQVVVGAVRDLKGVQKTSITVNTETTIVTAGGAGVFNDVYVLLCTNKSATGVFVDFKDATAGTTRMTLAVPANDTRGFTVPVDSAMVQAVAANNWTATVSAAVSSIEITALFVANI